jgi:hypothetical protein
MVVFNLGARDVLCLLLSSLLLLSCFASQALDSRQVSSKRTADLPVNDTSELTRERKLQLDDGTGKAAGRNIYLAEFRDQQGRRLSEAAYGVASICSEASIEYWAPDTAGRFLNTLTTLNSQTKPPAFLRIQQVTTSEFPGPNCKTAFTNPVHPSNFVPLILPPQVLVFTLSARLPMPILRTFRT